MLTKIVESCQFLLNHYPHASHVKDYLNSRISQSSQDKFQFGYFPDMENISVLTSMIGNSSLEDNSLMYNNHSKSPENYQYPKIIKTSYFDNYPVIMPYKNPYGEIVGIVGRSILPEQQLKSAGISKYKNTPESPTFKKSHLLFGLFENKQNIIDNDLVYVVEGQFDVIKATEAGLNNIVAIGSANMSLFQFSLLIRYTKNIILLLDNDDAGENGRNQIINKFGAYANITNLFIPPPFKDIDEFLSKNSPDELSFNIMI